jgi:hypothetical protein
MDKPSYTPHNRTTGKQVAARELLYDLFRRRPLPENELLINLGLYIRSSALAKFLFLDELYRKIMPLPGDIMVFGTWWGQDAVVLYNLRAVHEPYNYNRKVIGFDTFEGYPAPTKQDRGSDTIKEGAYHVSDNYAAYLNELMTYHSQENVMGHAAKFRIVAGDVTETLETYFAAHPETLVSLAYLDLALYEPSKRVLELLKPRMVKGGVLALDELNAEDYPGETVAFREVFGLQDHVLARSQILPDRSYLTI